MTAEFFSSDSFTVLSNPGVDSVQLISPENSPRAQATLTRVTMQPGAVQARHTHESSEQVWVALAGAGDLLLADDARRPFNQGEVARFPAGTVHGFENAGTEPFEYLSVTTPPVDHSSAYAEKR